MTATDLSIMTVSDAIVTTNRVPRNTLRGRSSSINIIVLWAWASVWVYLGHRRVDEMDDRNSPWARHHCAKVGSDKTQT